VRNKGAGAVTITPATSTINGAATLVLAANQGAFIWSDGANYQAFVFGVPLSVGTTTGTVAAGDDARIVRADARGDFAGMSNGTFVASASAGTLTVVVKTLAGVDPSAGDPVYFYFRNATLAAGGYDRVAYTAAMSLVLGSTKTLGSRAFSRLWLTVHNDAGTPRFGGFIASDANGFWCPQEYLKYSTTVPDNTAKAFHSTTAIATAAPWRLIGFCEWTSSQTPGTWTVPDILQLFTAGMKKPGDVVQSSSIVPASQTNISGNAPTATVIAISITPTSAANPIKVSAATSLYQATSGFTIGARLRRGVSVAFGSQMECYSGAGGVSTSGAMIGVDNPNSISAQTYTVYVTGNNVSASGVIPLTSDTSFISADELMG
jgi:hypothetical protein